MELTTPQPAMTDAVWGGQTTGAIYDCTLLGTPGQTSTFQFWAPPSAVPPPAVDPAVLAKTALAKLTIALPTNGRYPSGELSDGTPFAAVGYRTWWWSSNAPESATATQGTESATVTVTPTSLTWNPGDGSPTLDCNTLGTAYTDAYPRYSASPSGCDYVYPRNSGNEPGQVVTATWTVTWDVAYTASTGATGTLPAVTSTSTETYEVANTEAVVIK